jgi:broad specificity phosphatase PhoE
LTLPVGEIVLIRHGATEWSESGRHTSYTDVDITPGGEQQARRLAAALAGWNFIAVFSSPRKRALRTAELAGLRVTEVDDDLAEWDYGQYEGRTTPEIRQSQPDWYLWRDGCPGGESAGQVGERLDRTLGAARMLLDAGDVALVGHGHALRVAGARWIALPPERGGLFRLETGTLCALGHEHGHQVIRRWNAPV